MKTVLTIAGSDCSGGAGIQADIKTITAHRMYAMSAITALTAQNTTGVYGIMDVTPAFLEQQLDCVFTDIRPDAVKIGMVSDAALIRVIAAALVKYQAQNIVIDPVMVATSGGVLLKTDAVETLIQELLPLGTVVTPNIPEAEVLAGCNIETAEDMQQAAERISCGQGAVLIKGGHLTDSADDLLYENGSCTWFLAQRVDTQNTHGTGCTLSSVIACGLAEGKPVAESVRQAKEFVYGALADGLDLGAGSGPLNHCYRMK